MNLVKFIDYEHHQEQRNKERMFQDKILLWDLAYI
jgi:hypothetical protein